MARTVGILIADEGKARLFEAKTGLQSWTHRRTWANPVEREPERSARTAPPARGRTIGTGGRYAIEESSLREQAAEAFLIEVAKSVSAAALEGAFDRLVIAAPGKALGVLRRHVASDIYEGDLVEWSKDLTNMPDERLREYCRERLGPW